MGEARRRKDLGLLPFKQEVIEVAHENKRAVIVGHGRPPTRALIAMLALAAGVNSYLDEIPRHERR